MSRHEKRCQMVERLFVVFHHSRNIQCYRSAAGKRVGNEILDTFNGPVGMALFLLSQNPATPRMRPTEITSTASTRKISSDNVVSQRKTLPEIKAGVSITYCEVFGSSRRRSIAQVMNYQSGHSGRNY